MPDDPISRLSEQFDMAMQTLKQIRLGARHDTETAFPQYKAAAREKIYQAAVRSFQDRRARSTYFSGHDIFGEPAWDILLDLYIHECRETNMSVKSASIGSGAPATTALRWLKVLEGEGLVYSAEDPADSRRRLVRLTPEGHQSMTDYLSQIVR